MFSTTLQHCLHFSLERRKSWPFLSSHKQHCVTFKLPEGSKKQATFNFGFGERELKAPRLFLMFSTTLQHCLHFSLERRKSWPFLSSHKQHCVTFKLPEGSKKQATFNFGFGERELKAPRLFFPNKDLWSFDVNISKIMPLTVAFKSMQVYT